MILNEILFKYNFFVKFFKRRDKFRFLTKKKVVRKNEMTRSLSSSAIEKFNGYEFIKQKLTRKEKVDFTAIDIVYEPPYNENLPIACFFINQIHLAYRSYTGRIKNGKEQILHSAVKQCHYCQIFFKNNDENMKKHMSVSAGKEGITCVFDNGQIVNFQDNFKFLGNVPFTVYFDFETTTSNFAFSDPKMYVISYCQIYSFHPSLNLDKIVIFWSFQQTSERSLWFKSFQTWTCSLLW